MLGYAEQHVRVIVSTRSEYCQNIVEHIVSMIFLSNLRTPRVEKYYFAINYVQ